MAHSAEHELLAHAQALRSLARDLVGEHDADDLVQDTIVQVLRQPPRQPGRLGGWFAAIARHLASTQRRSARHRMQREQRVARPEAVPPDREGEERESFQCVTRAVLDLPEPYQSTVLQRYLRELTTNEIAERAGVPVATVKTRVRRGLALLRERLEREGGADWRPALASAFGLERAAPVGAVAALTSGILLMGTGVKLAIGGIAVLAVAATLFFAGNGPHTGPGTVTDARDRAQVVSVAADQGRSAVREQEVSTAQRTAVLRPAAGNALATIRGRCVDGSGVPVGGVSAQLLGTTADPEELRVWLAQHPQSELMQPQSAFMRPHSGPMQQQFMTGADGRFVFQVEAPPSARFTTTLSAAGFVTLQATCPPPAEGSTTDLGDVLMPHGVLVHGVVHDTDGAPMAVSGSLNRKPQQEPLSPPTEVRRPATTGVFSAVSRVALTTQPNGTFAVTLAPDAYEVQLTKSVITAGERFTLPAASTTFELEVVVKKPSDIPTITGIVTNEHGIAIERVTVLGLGSALSSNTTDREGRFELQQSKRDDAEVHLMLRKSGYEELRPQEAFAWGRHDLVLELLAELAVEVHVVADADGAPVEDYELRLLPRNGSMPGMSMPGRNGNDSDVKSSGHHAGGVTMISGPSRGPAYVFVQAMDPALATSTMVPVEVMHPAPVQVQVRLPRAVQRIVHVQRADGSPVIGTKLQLADPLTLVPPPNPSASPLAILFAPARASPTRIENWFSQQGQHPDLLLQEATTDENGEVILHGPASLQLVLSLLGPGHARMTLRDVRLDVTEPLVVPISNGARLEGIVTPPEFVRDLLSDAHTNEALPKATNPGTVVRVIGPPRWQQPGFRLRRGPRSESYPPESAPPAAIGTDGSFVIEGVPAGTWQLELCKDCNLMGVVGSVAVREGETTKASFDLSTWIRGELVGSVFLNDHPLALQSVQLFFDDGRHPVGNRIQPTASTDASGHFHIPCPPGTFFLCSLRFDAARKFYSLLAPERVFVPAGGKVERAFHFTMGKLRVHLLESDGKPLAGVAVQLVDATGKGRASLPATDKDGFAEGELEAEPFTACVLPKRLRDPQALSEFFATADSSDKDPLAAVRQPISSVIVKQGETTTVELHLPAAWDR